MSSASTEFHCKACNRPDEADDMVACDTCGGWFHFSCVGVQASICNKPWYCKSCFSPGSSVHGSDFSMQTSSSNARLRLKQLEESKALEDRLQQQQAERERAYLLQKHQLELECSSGGGSYRSVRSRQSCASRLSEVQSWINQTTHVSQQFDEQPVSALTSTPVVITGSENVVSSKPTEAPERHRVDISISRQMPQNNVPFPNVPSIQPLTVVANPHTHTNVPPGLLVNNNTTSEREQTQFGQLKSINTNQLIPAAACQLSQKPFRQSPAPLVQESSTRNQREQHPPHPCNQMLPSANLPGQEEPSLSANVPRVEGYDPVRSIVRGEIQTDASEIHRRWMRPQQSQQQQNTYEQHYTAQPKAYFNQNVPSQTIPHVSSHTQWTQHDNGRLVDAQQRMAAGNHVPVPTMMNVPPPMVISQPFPYVGGYVTGGTGLNPPFTANQQSNTHPSSGMAPGGLPYVHAPTVSPGFVWGSGQTVPMQPSYYSQWPVNTEGILKAQQLAARQVVSRELPKFTGDPLEWPMVINAFESTTTMCGIQPDENLARLQKSLTGNAREKVQSILTLPAAIPEIIETLRDECGRPEQLVHCLLRRIRNAPLPNVNKLDTLITFGREVRNLVTYIEGAKLQDHLSNPMLLAELVGKLPPNLRLDWGLHTQRITQVSLKAFSEYVTNIKTAACHVSMPAEFAQSDDSYRKSKKKEFLNAHSVERVEGESNQDMDGQTDVKPKQEVKIDPKPCHACRKIDHRLRNCDKFTSFNVHQRKRLVEQLKLCQRCLGSHGKWPCRTKQLCGFDGCEESHHRLLHCVPTETVDTIEVVKSVGLISAHCAQQASTLFKIIPVVLSNNGKSISTFAFLDDGSSLTLLENGIAEELELEGEVSQLCLQWTGNVTRKEPVSQKVRLSISGINNGPKYTISDVLTVSSLDLPEQSLDYDGLLEKYPHLKGIPVQSFSCAVPRILIGLDNAKLNLTLDKRERRSGEPVAAKTRLGWTIFGGGAKRAQDAHRVMVHACDCSADASLHDLVKDYFSVEGLGVNPTLPLESFEDQRARQIMRQTTKRTENGRFECGLLWKSDDFEFPNSYAMAERRLVCLERKLKKDPDLNKKVAEQIEEHLERGYAHKITDDELCNSDPRRVWYLPLSVVQNPRKPGTVRLIWDAAARVGDVSLNSMLLAGPDLLTPLLKVLCGFRQRQYVSVGDVRQMLHQMLVRTPDQQALRFLYRPDAAQKPTIYVMNVLIFGASCSPCLAQYVKNMNAREFEGQYPEAADAIINNTYVDDFLDSRETIDEVVKIVDEVRMIYGKAGFDIRNWQSNSEEVL